MMWYLEARKKNTRAAKLQAQTSPLAQELNCWKGLVLTRLILHEAGRPKNPSRRNLNAPTVRRKQHGSAAEERRGFWALLIYGKPAEYIFFARLHDAKQ